MKIDIKSLTSSVALLSAAFILPLSSQAAYPFNVTCGTQKYSVTSLLNIEKMPFNVPCVINQITTANIAIQCKGKSGLLISDRHGLNRSPIYNDNHLTIGRYNGIPARDQFVISRNNKGSLIMAAHLNINTQFARTESLTLASNASGTKCDVLPFNWSQTGGC